MATSNVPHIFDAYTTILSQKVNENFSFVQDEISQLSPDQFVSLAAVTDNPLGMLQTTKRLYVQFRAPNYTMPYTLSGGMHLRRISFADLTNYPASSYIRSQDRFMPDGSIDATNGGYWVHDDPIIIPDQLGALRDSLFDNTSVFNDCFKLAFLTNKPVRPIAGGAYRTLGIMNMYWGTNLVFYEGAVMKYSNPISFIDPTATVYPALFVFSSIIGGRWMPKGISPKCIDANTQFQNSSGPGVICGLAVQNNVFIADATDIYGYRSSPLNYSTICIYCNNVAMVHLDGNWQVGGFEITAPFAGTDDTRFVKLDGQTIRFTHLATNNHQSNCYGIEVAGAVEGFEIDISEIIYVRRGIHIENTTQAGGGRIRGGHINCSERGIYCKNRKINVISDVNIWRGNYETRPTWKAIELDTVVDGYVSGVLTNPSSLAIVSHGVYAANCNNVRILNVEAKFNTYAVYLENSTYMMLDHITGDSNTVGILVDATCANITVGRYSFPNIAGTRLQVLAGATSVYTAPRMGAVDSTTTVISAAGTEQVGPDKYWIRRQFNGGPYTYNIQMNATGAHLKDEQIMSLNVTANNITVNLNDNTGATLLTLPLAINKYTINTIFNGANWRINCAAVSLI